MQKLTLQSPAKLNLYLKVFNKRKDGFHNILTLFERINLSDEICFSSNKSGKIRIICDHPQVPKGPKNLVYKVARLLKDDFNISRGVDIKIKKVIPVAAGLAGGSSNAACALVGLNTLWNLKLSKNLLLKYAAQLGSDISFFIHNTPWGLGAGRGEAICPLKKKLKLWHILIIPRVKLYSHQVYEGLKLRSKKDKIVPEAIFEAIKSRRPAKEAGCTNLLTKAIDDVSIFIRNFDNSNINIINAFLFNSLESSIIKLYPGIVKIKERLKSLKVKGVMISGSGPCVFGITESEQAARSVQSVLSKRYSQVYVARTL